jgi:hypothetical protein
VLLTYLSNDTGSVPTHDKCSCSADSSYISCWPIWRHENDYWAPHTMLVLAFLLRIRRPRVQISISRLATLTDGQLTTFIPRKSTMHGMNNIKKNSSMCFLRSCRQALGYPRKSDQDSFLPHTSQLIIPTQLPWKCFAINYTRTASFYMLPN